LFGRAAERRIVALLDAADGRRQAVPPRLPYEWLPVTAASLAVAVCQLPAATSLL